MNEANGIVTISRHVGYNTTGITCTHSKNGVYTFTMPAHPSGTDYLLMLSPYTQSSGYAANWPTGYGQTSTNLFVYVRSAIAGTTTTNGNFFVYTAP